MRIQGWECAISPSGDVRTAKHPESGTAVSINGRFVGHADVPREVMLWLLRPLLRQIWESGCDTVLGTPSGTPVEKVYAMNPYNGEPLNKDNDPS